MRVTQRSRLATVREYLSSTVRSLLGSHSGDEEFELIRSYCNRAGMGPRVPALHSEEPREWIYFRFRSR
jgi:hypothetical protein